MCESTEASNRVVKWDVNFYCSGYEVLDVFELLEVIFALDIFTICYDHSSLENCESYVKFWVVRELAYHKPTKTSDTISLSDSKN